MWHKLGWMVVISLALILIEREYGGLCRVFSLQK